MEELNPELLGRLLGYCEWAAEVSWHKQRHDAAKKEFLTQLEKQKKSGFQKNAEILGKVSTLVVQKQVPFHKQNVHVHEDIHETMNALKPLFMDMHAELFVEDAVYAAEKMHEHAVLLQDTVSSQAALFKAIGHQTYADYLPQILFLYDKEVESEEKLKDFAADAAKSSNIILKHMNDNYFVRMKKLAADQQYIEDHRQLFVASYAVGLCSRALGMLYGLPGDELKVTEDVFLKNIVQKH